MDSVNTHDRSGSVNDSPHSILAKQHWRRTSLARRAALRRADSKHRSELSQAITANMLVVAQSVPGNVLSYLSMPSEPDTAPFHSELLRRGVPVMVPNPDFWPTSDPGDALEAFGILTESGTVAPAPEQWTDSAMLCFVPGLAFDANGARLGRGAGWYDQVLPALRLPTHQTQKTLILGVCFESEYHGDPTLPFENHDFFVDGVVTEKSVHIF